MTIQFRCPGCSSKLSAKAALAGQSRPCPKCNLMVEVPRGSSPAGEPPAKSAQPSRGESAGPPAPRSPKPDEAESGDVASQAEQPATHSAPATPSNAPPAASEPIEGFEGLDEPLAHVHRPNDEQRLGQEFTSDTSAGPGDAAGQIHDVTSEKLPEADRPQRLNRDHRYLIVDRHRLVAAWQNDGNGWQVKTVSGMIDAAPSPDHLPPRGNFTLIELKTNVHDDGMHLEGLQAYQLAPRYAMTKLQRGDDEICAAVQGPGSLNRDQKNAVRRFLREHFMQTIWENASEVLEFLGNTDYHSSGVG